MAYNFFISFVRQPGKVRPVTGTHRTTKKLGFDSAARTSDYVLLQSVQTRSTAHPVSQMVVTRIFFAGGLRTHGGLYDLTAWCLNTGTTLPFFFTICIFFFPVLIPFVFLCFSFYCFISFPVLVAEVLITDAVNNKLPVHTDLRPPSPPPLPPPPPSPHHPRY